MANRRLTADERELANALIKRTLLAVEKIADGDGELLFALRRRLIVQLTIAERGTPAHRNALKRRKFVEQNGVCPLCNNSEGPLPQKYAELDRIVASAGYTDENTRLVHHKCHVDDQARKKYL